jgi:hypothetical protein
MAKRDAYTIGFQYGKEGTPRPRRAYESDKANKEFFRGYADGVAAAHPGQMIVRCKRDGTIFAAFPQSTTIPVWNDTTVTHKTTSTITCPTCGRRYIREDNGDYVSDRKLTVLKIP